MATLATLPTDMPVEGCQYERLDDASGHLRAAMRVYLNRAIVDAGQAQVSVADAGFTHAVGLVQTMAARVG